MKHKNIKIYTVACTILILLGIVSCANINLNGIYTNVNAASEKILESDEDINNLSVYVRNTEELNTLCNALRLKKKSIRVGLDLSYSDFNYIGEAFIDCKCLVSVKLPDRLTAIDANAFKGCDNLIEITIPKNVQSIKPYAFFGCKNLRTVSFDGTICKSIEYGAFMDCPDISTFTIPASVQKIGINAFSLSDNVTFSVDGTNDWQYKKDDNTEHLYLNNSASYSWRYELTR